MVRVASLKHNASGTALRARHLDFVSEYCGRQQHDLGYRTLDCFAVDFLKKSSFDYLFAYGE